MNWYQREMYRCAEANYWTFRICSEWPDDCSDEMKELAMRVGRDLA